ncbi:hypothetical protein DWW02_27060, partial [Enterocloster bolteae]
EVCFSAHPNIQYRTFKYMYVFDHAVGSYCWFILLIHMLPLCFSSYSSGIPSICLHIYSISSVPYLWSQVKDSTWL